MNLPLRGPLARRPSASAEAESWFLERGLPSVLTTRGRWRRLWPRSAPMLAAYATVQACGIPIYLIAGSHEVQIEREPTTAEWVVPGVIVAAIPLAAIVGWLVSRLSHSRIRAVTATIVVVVAAVAGVIDAGPGQLPATAVVVVLVLILTCCCVGAVLGWALRMMLSHLATVGALVVRALPVVLLTAVVFFNGYVWLMAATISGDRIGLAMAFLVSIAAAFVISATRERVRPMLQSTTVLPNDTEKLADTPFATMLDAPDCAPLKRAERLNVVFVLAASQLAQILVVAVVAATIYFWG
jgi:hypothetical protein